jgi:hypothetical protein
MATSGHMSDDFYANHSPEFNDAPAFDDETVNADGYSDAEIDEMLCEAHIDDDGEDDDDDAAYENMLHGYDSDTWE